MPEAVCPTGRAIAGRHGHSRAVYSEACRSENGWVAGHSATGFQAGATGSDPDGQWLLDRIHPGRVHFDLEGGVGTPSRWNTLRALRVLKWWEGIA